MALISALALILSRDAFSTLSILPRRGRTAWFSRLLASLADPPAESPSTMNSSHSPGFLLEQSASLPGRESPDSAVLRRAISLASDTPMTARKRLEEKRPNTFIGRSFGVGDVIVWDEEKGRKFFYVDKEELVEFGGFMDADAAGNTVIYMVPNYQIDGKTGTWLPYDSEVVEGVCFFMMRNEQRKDAVSPVVVDSKGVFVTDAPNGFENVRSTLTEYVQRAEKKQQDMTEHEKCLTNGTYERARESGTEQNYDMIDGCVNNVPKKPRRIGGRWSVLDRLHIKQAQRKQKDQTQQQQQERSRKN